jgi:hypothetical protein
MTLRPTNPNLHYGTPPKLRAAIGAAQGGSGGGGGITYIGDGMWIFDPLLAASQPIAGFTLPLDPPNG